MAVPLMSQVRIMKPYGGHVKQRVKRRKDKEGFQSKQRQKGARKVSIQHPVWNRKVKKRLVLVSLLTMFAGINAWIG